MSIEVIRIHGAVTAVCHRENGKTSHVDLSPIEVLGPDLDRLLKPVLAEILLHRDDTARGVLLCLKQLGEAFAVLGCRRLPDSHNGWQELVLNVHRFIHTRTDRRQSLMTRHLVVWHCARRCFRILMDEGLVPVSVHLPPVLETLVLDERREGLLGYSAAVEVTEQRMINKLLLPISLARTDAEYLDEIHDGLLVRRQTLFDCLKDYWDRLRVNLEFGRKLRSSLTEAELEKLIRDHESGACSRDHPGRSLETLADYLIVLERLYDGSAFRYRGKTAETRSIANLKDFPSVKDWPIAGQLPPNFAHLTRFTNNYLIWWWLGRISHLDVAFIAALLTMLHPRWTPSALIDAVVTNRNGKAYLDVGGEGVGFEVKKHRAKAMKHEVLDALSYEILSTMIDYSADVRPRLPADQAIARRLFLPHGKVAEPGAISVSLPIHSLAVALLSGRTSAKGATWLGSLYPALKEVGLGPGTISFKKIRATEGVLEWFRTKSLRAASKRIGNSERVILEHYIPDALLQAWMARSVRRFQNLWITVAAAGEPFLLDVTDFPSLAGLNAFVADILRMHAPSSSPLAAELHLRIATRDSIGVPDARRGNLHVSLSKASLSTLYSYHAAASASAVPRAALRQVDPATGVAPDAFLQLADLLQVQLPVDRNPDYRRLHEQAMAEAANRTRVAAWSQLFVGGAYASCPSTP